MSSGGKGTVSIVMKGKEPFLAVAYKTGTGQQVLEISKKQFTNLYKFSSNIPVLSKMIEAVINAGGSRETKLLKAWITGLKKAAWNCGMIMAPDVTNMLSIAESSRYDMTTAFPTQDDIDGYSSICKEYNTEYGELQILPEMMKTTRRVVAVSTPSQRLFPVTVVGPRIHLTPAAPPAILHMHIQPATENMGPGKNEDIYAPLVEWRSEKLDLDKLKVSEWYSHCGRIAKIPCSDYSHTGSTLLTDVSFTFSFDDTENKKAEKLQTLRAGSKMFTAIVFHVTASANVDLIIKHSSLFCDLGSIHQKLTLQKFTEKTFGVDATDLCTGKPYRLHLRSTKKFIDTQTFRVQFAYVRHNTRSRLDMFTDSIREHSETREKIVEKLISEQDDDENETDIMGVNETVSLKCPLSQNTITYPVRGYSCKHLQCFDLISYLEYNLVCKDKCLLKCPVCSVYTPMGDLFLDGLTESILNEHSRLLGQHKNSDDENELRVPETFSICCSTGEIIYGDSEYQFEDLLSKRQHPASSKMQPPKKKKKQDLVILDE